MGKMELSSFIVQVWMTLVINPLDNPSDNKWASFDLCLECLFHRVPEPL